MKALDFISGAPKTFIFQQGSNKTNLGGILTVLFIIAIIVIIFAYLYEYIANEKYVVSYYYNEEHYEDEELDNKYDNKMLYPELSLGLGLIILFDFVVVIEAVFPSLILSLKLEYDVLTINDIVSDLLESFIVYSYLLSLVNPISFNVPSALIFSLI